MSKKKKQDVEVPNPLRVNEAEFTEVIRKMVNTSPVTREEVEEQNRKNRRLFRKNPEKDPSYLPVFDFSTPMKLTPEEQEQVRLTDEMNARYRREQKRKRKS
jgi:hypothetical protein